MPFPGNKQTFKGRTGEATPKTKTTKTTPEASTIDILKFLENTYEVSIPKGSTKPSTNCEGLLVKNENGKVTLNDVFADAVEALGGVSRSDVSKALKTAHSNLKEVASAPSEDNKVELTVEQIWDELSEHVKVENGGLTKLIKAFPWNPYFGDAKVGSSITHIELVGIYKELLYIKLKQGYSWFFPTIDVMTKNFDFFKQYQIDKNRKELFDVLRFDPTLDADAVYEDAAESFKFKSPAHDITMIKHFIWAVKRKEFNMPITHPIFLMLVSEQGIGKTTIVERLVGPLGSFALPVKFRDLADEKLTGMAQSYNVLTLDELDPEESRTLAAFKNWVSSDELSNRTFYTQEMQRFDKKAQGIGTSNFPVEELMRDETGNRRIYEIYIDGEKNQLLEAFQSKREDMLDGGDFWVKLWQSVDENKEEGYFNPQEHEEIVHIMSAAVGNDPVDELIEHILYNDVDLTTLDTVDRKFLAGTDIYTAYKEYVDDNRIKGGDRIDGPTFSKRFAKKIKSFDPLSSSDARQKDSSGKRTSGFMIPIGKAEAIKRSKKVTIKAGNRGASNE